MARKCELCGKSTVYGHNVSHAKNRTRRTWFPNLVAVKTKIEGTVKTLKICTRCLKGNKIVKHV
ncbi:MAG: 50S ribosomal protein L28 [Spirochaetes bacterium]|nr:50S ribosomal protein L28 [Spirochaetota bacterium]